MNCLLDPSSPDIDSAAQRILVSEAHGQLLPLFFEMMWRKQGRDKTGKLVDHTLDPDAVRVADAIVIQRGRPIQWYFSSVREKGVLLSKQRKNVTAETIVDHFLSKKNLSISGVCAQFIEPCETSRQGTKSTFITSEKFQVWLSTLPSSRSGILHRFLDPIISPGASQNWEISCLWTPSAIDADRVESSRDLKDRSIPSDLRCDVFKPEVSTMKRLVCGRHVAMVDNCCRAISEHVEIITGGRTHISTLELQCKVGANDHLVVLYPKRMIFTANDGKRNIELQLPCILPVKIPLEYTKVMASTSSSKNTSATASQNASFASTPSGGGYNHRTDDTSSSLIMSTIKKNNHKNDNNDSFNFSALTRCIVCKRSGSQVMSDSILIPLKHVMLGLEIIAAERGPSGKTKSSETTIPLHVSMLFPELTQREYESRRMIWGEDKVDVCKECSTALKEAVKK